ncbi:MAG: peptide deformylase [Clostridia bacterium]|nr:peptide deformylase [Clostridia bacterium]
MVQPIMHDPLFLAQPSAPVTPADRQVAIDLVDTLRAHEDGCVGMAANMIGVHKRIIVINAGFMPMVLINPIITGKSGPYQAEEGCLSLAGVRKTTRYQEIDVAFLDMDFKPRQQHFSGWAAQIIQHEVDHCDGILI